MMAAGLDADESRWVVLRQAATSRLAFTPAGQPLGHKTSATPGPPGLAGLVAGLGTRVISC